MGAEPGEPSPLGATWDGEGVNFAVYSQNATAVDLCLFAADAPGVEVRRVALLALVALRWLDRGGRRKRS